jgi:nicotinate dehydrogenase subunit B
MDVMASRVGMDPLEFRLKNLADKRMIRVLRAFGEKFGWTPAKAASGRGYGVVCFDYLNTYVAAMAEIKVNKNTGQIQVKNHLQRTCQKGTCGRSSACLELSFRKEPTEWEN